MPTSAFGLGIQWGVGITMLTPLPADAAGFDSLAFSVAALEKARRGSRKDVRERR